MNALSASRNLKQNNHRIVLSLVGLSIVQKVAGWAPCKVFPACRWPYALKPSRGARRCGRKQSAECNALKAQRPYATRKS